MQLNEVYENREKFLALLTKAKGSSKLGEPYKQAFVGEPLVIEDNVLQSLYEMIFIVNTDYIPGKLPAIGLLIGDYYTHEGKETITGNYSVATLNMAYLHAGRCMEEEFIAWEKIHDTVKENLVTLCNLLEKDVNRPSVGEQLNAELYDYVGFTSTGFPSLKFIKMLQSVISDYSASEEENIAILAQSIVNQCQPFSQIAKEIEQLRNKIGCKGVLGYKNGKLYSTTPAYSGGASWFQLTSNDLYHAVPSHNNLFFFAAHANKLSGLGSAMGGGLKPEKSISFIIPEGIAENIQKEIDSNENLITLWNQGTMQVLKTDTDKTMCKKANDWFFLVQQQITEIARSLLKEKIHACVLGLQFDISDSSGNAYLRPVITRSYAVANEDLFKELQIETIDAGIEKFFGEVSDGYFEFKLPLKKN
jgi:hypothetical protein